MKTKTMLYTPPK